MRAGDRKQVYYKSWPKIYTANPFPHNYELPENYMRLLASHLDGAVDAEGKEEKK